MDKYGFETKAVHSGWTPDSFSRSTSVPIYLTNAYAFESAEYARKLFALEEQGNIYTRLSNPQPGFGKRIAALEGGVGAVATSSGHAAIYAVILTLAGYGDEIISSSAIYGGAVNMFAHTLTKSGIKTIFVHPTDLSGFESAITENTKAVFVETLGNPSCDVADIDALAEIAHRHGIPLIVDNTFATPYLFCPIEHGADIVLHSSTKFIAGNGCVMGGLIIDSGKFDWSGSGRFPSLCTPDPSYHGITFTKEFGAAAFITKLRTCTMRDMGFSPSPFNSFLLILGFETLALRMRRMSDSAKAVAEYLETHRAVEAVRSPYVKSSPYYELAKRLMPRGCGAVLSFDIKGGKAAGIKFIDSLRLFSNVANLGDSKSLVNHSASTTHSQLNDEQLAATGISPGTIRLSIGLESPEDILKDIENALELSQS